jgi:hypothetical protein
MRTLRSLRMRHRLVGAVMALALGCTVLVLSSAQPAQAAATYRSNGFGCGNWGAGRQVNAYPPQMTSVSGGLEKVYWSPDLYRWNGAAWVLYDSSKPWYWAVANGNGVVNQQYLQGGTWFQPNNFAIIYATYNYLPAGSYAVVDHYQWSNGATRDVWSYFRGTGGGYSCTFYS